MWNNIVAQSITFHSHSHCSLHNTLTDCEDLLRAMSEPVYDPSKSKLHYQVLQPGGYSTWFKDSERYHRSSGDWKWMEEDEGDHVSWKTLINDSEDLKAHEKRKELYEEEKVCGRVRLHTASAFQEQT